MIATTFRLGLADAPFVAPPRMVAILQKRAPEVSPRAQATCSKPMAFYVTTAILARSWIRAKADNVLPVHPWIAQPKTNAKTTGLAIPRQANA